MKKIECTLKDVRTAKLYDPAAPCCFMIHFTYPGVIALRRHRRAHKLWLKGRKNLARFISYKTRKKTGIDIHPGATIGQGVFIDHGMGTVIGETAVIGNGCVLYHGVTLGANTFEKVDRHPKLGDGCIVFAGATLLGPIHIGEGSVIAAGAVVVKDAPPHSKLKGIPAHHNL
ncbi:MAG: serine O-acetyltransferase EpsC [Acholeplasmataceae bacterium]